MDIDRRGILACLAALPAMPFGAARAQAYPDRPIRWVVPVPPGGGIDTQTRILTNALAVRLGQPIVVENRPGASGTIGVHTVARSPADGYTLLTGEMGIMAMSPALYRSLPYDVTADLEPVSPFTRIPLLLAVNPDTVPVTNWEEFAAYARARPGRVPYASFGAGSINHVMTAMLEQRAGLKLLHVPYKGGAPAIQDLLGGQVGVIFDNYGSLEQHIKAGKLRVIGVSTQARHPQMPAVPSLQEAGVADFDVASWLGVFAPAGTPAAILDRLQGEVDAVMRQPEVRKAYADRGVIPVTSARSAFRQALRDELQKWDAVIKASKIELN